MTIYPINTGNFKLDGGAMFGVVPKSLWTRTNPADANNMCDWTMRCMLIEYSDKLVLIDTGIGDKQNEKFFSHFYLFGDNTLEKSIKALGFGLDEITDVFLTHLHFDHCGGAIKYDATTEKYVPTFKNAEYWSNDLHWKWATEPNPREKASFLKENILPIEATGQLNFVKRKGEWSDGDIFPGFKAFFVDGHTESQMIPYIDYKGKTIIFAADLLPSVGHIPLPYVMGYDVRPLMTLKEKAQFLNDAAAKEQIIFLEHDIANECAVVHETEKGVRLKSTHSFQELFS